MSVLFAVAMLASAGNAVVLEPVANMYARPTREADVVSQAIYGANVAVLESKPGWIKVRTVDDYTGWMVDASVKAGPPYAAKGRVAEVESLFAHIYREASVTRHEPLVTVPFETRLEVAAEPPDNEGWLQVRLPDDPFRLGAARRYHAAAPAPVDRGNRGTGAPFPGPAVHLGRHVELRV